MIDELKLPDFSSYREIGIVMLNFKLKKAIWASIYRSDASYIKNFSVAQLNWERNKQDGKSLKPTRILVRK